MLWEAEFIQFLSVAQYCFFQLSKWNSGSMMKEVALFGFILLWQKIILNSTLDLTEPELGQ